MLVEYETTPTDFEDMLAAHRRNRKLSDSDEEAKDGVLISQESFIGGGDDVDLRRLNRMSVRIEPSDDMDPNRAIIEPSSAIENFNVVEEVYIDD